ncbi:METACASPASE-4 [Salix viminalis]|uniref:METACASPASE-4 n=1 Tax=Salix viminalis TaxID=40686 RepID=A0A9Q0NLQ8_SALVM|nr:METACASPASE-4 [Salix viminalis]
MYKSLNCSNCSGPDQQLPPGANLTCCAICQGATTVVADPSAAPPPPALSYSSSSQYDHVHPPNHPSLVVPSPYNHAPPGPPPAVHGTKRAVICGVSYKNTKNELEGSINDVICMKFLLVKRFNFPESSIIMLTEEETDPCRRPTKSNMRLALSWLVQGCQPGDSLVFHFSGHGSQKKDYDGDELDGYDETLCPTDFETQGMIVDDEINAVIVKPLPHGVKLHAIIDACHSGTVLDLPFLCRMDRNGKYVWEDHRPRTGEWKGTSGGEVFSFSSCDDDQTAADTPALSKITSTGAMTYSFILAIERGHATTYGSMLNAMRSTIRDTTNELGGGILTSLISMFLTGRTYGGEITQEPQLTASEQFDVYSKPFSL